MEKQIRKHKVQLSLQIEYGVVTAVILRCLDSDMRTQYSNGIIGGKDHPPLSKAKIKIARKLLRDQHAKYCLKEINS